MQCQSFWPGTCDSPRPPVQCPASNSQGHPGRMLVPSWSWRCEEKFLPSSSTFIHPYPSLFILIHPYSSLSVFIHLHPLSLWKHIFTNHLKTLWLHGRYVTGEPFKVWLLRELTPDELLETWACLHQSLPPLITSGNQLHGLLENHPFIDDFPIETGNLRAYPSRVGWQRVNLHQHCGVVPGIYNWTTTHL